MSIETLVDRGLLPDPVVRFGIRRLLNRRLQEEDGGDVEVNQVALMDWIGQLRGDPIALHTEDANSQHYEVPAAFFENVLGPRLKYSSGLWKPGVETLDQAEEAMLALTCERAQLVDGMDVLDLGCGWGSLTAYVTIETDHLIRRCHYQVQVVGNQQDATVQFVAYPADQFIQLQFPVKVHSLHRFVQYKKVRFAGDSMGQEYSLKFTA